MPTSFNYEGRPGYIYNQADDVWYEIGGRTDTTASYEWAGIHDFLSSVTVIDHLIGKKGINNFLNPAARDAAITSPTAGTICFLRQDAIGTTINELQVYIGGAWTTILPTPVGQSGKYLTSDGSNVSWGTVDTIPSQTSNSGKYLTTDGSSLSWGTVDSIPSQTGNSGKFLTTNGSALSWADQAYVSAINSQSGTTYTFVLDDHKKTVITTSSSAVTLTIPRQSDVAWPDGALLTIVQNGTGAVTVQAGTGVTLNTQGASGARKMRYQHQVVSCFRTSSDTWMITGDLVVP